MNRWNTSNIIALISLIIAILGLLISIAIPELRCLVGLSPESCGGSQPKPTLTPTQTSVPISPPLTPSIPPINWDELKQYFRITNVRILRDQDLLSLGLGGSFRPEDVLAFNVEAMYTLPCAVFLGVFYDREGVELELRGSHQIAFRPIKSTWEKGSIRRGYLILPSNISKIKIKSLCPLPGR